MQILRKILFPFAILYGGIVSLRNYFYDKGWFESRSYDLPVICIGNLSTGGTGKSPMTQYLMSFLLSDYKVATLSRGYKRKTSGYREVGIDSTAIEVGDEPLQFKKNFPKALVAVAESRFDGIEKLKNRADVILLDDAFQHRKVQPSTSLLLTPFDDLYSDDYMLPTGNLREPRSGADRANIIMVTKCPDTVPYAMLQEVQFKLKLQPGQEIFFSKIGYDEFIYGVSETLPLNYLLDKNFTLVTGIANPKPLIEFLTKRHLTFEHERFADHHDFSSSEVNTLKTKEIILTTEKDFMRLQPKLGKYALYYLPIKTIILNDREDYFKKLIVELIDNTRFH